MKNTSDPLDETIPLGCSIQMASQKKDRLLNGYPSPMDITATQPHMLCSIRCKVCITPIELKTVSFVDPGAMTCVLGRLACKGWTERLPNPADKRGVLVQLTPGGVVLRKQCHQVVGRKLYQELTKSLSTDEVIALEQLLKKTLP